MPRKDITLYAKWSALSYNITYDLDGGDDLNTPNNPVSYTYDIGVSSFGDLTKVGHTFEGWYDAKTAGTKITNISKTEIGDKTLYARFNPNKYTIKYELDGGQNGSNPSEYTYGVGVKQFAPATKTGYRFLGWFDNASGGNPITEISETSLGTQTLYAQWIKTYTISFKNYDGTSDVLPSKVIDYDKNTLSIPDAPKEDYHFLCWSETKSAAKTNVVYVPEKHKIIQNKLNSVDQNYLGYKVRSEHEITNITSDKTLYAVYYKTLKATSRANESNPTAQEFIWNDAIWRVVNTKDAGSKRLVIKGSALTEAEVTGLGISLEKGPGMEEEQTRSDALSVHFHSQNGPADTDSERYYFNSNSDDGYERSRLKEVIDKYYNQLGDKDAVEEVTLNTPDFAIYTGVGFGGNSGGLSTYNNWSYRDSWGDTRFETSFTGKKQAFALSYGDIHGAMGIPKKTYTTLLLDFYGVENRFWLRSADRDHDKAGAVTYGGFHYDVPGIIKYPEPVRPALYLSVE